MLVGHPQDHLLVIHPQTGAHQVEVTIPNQLTKLNQKVPEIAGADIHTVKQDTEMAAVLVPLQMWQMALKKQNYLMNQALSLGAGLDQVQAQHLIPHHPQVVPQEVLHPHQVND